MRMLAVAVVGVAFGAVASTIHYHGDLPDETHAWCVHDLNRPHPTHVSAEEGKAPSDAVVLFDGTQTSVDAHWCDKDGEDFNVGFTDVCDTPYPEMRRALREIGTSMYEMRRACGASGK